MGTTEKPHIKRDNTDQSLSAERQKSDSELDKRRENVEQDADEVVRLARERADVVLNQAREHADDQLGPKDASSEAQEHVLQERAVADKVLRQERLVMDEQVLIEREQLTRDLHDLLGSEREATDESLSAERSYSDQAVVSRDDFLGLVSHELQGSLSGISLYAAILIKQSADDAPGREVVAHADKIQRLVVHTQRLASDLMDLASIEAGRLKISAKDDDVARLAHEAVEIFRPAFAAKRVQLTLEAPTDPVQVKFDRQRILQVLTNLLTNAIKFTAEGGKVVVRVEPKGEHVRVSVSDNGRGVPEDKLNAIFERFKQVAADDPRGAGLGLFIAKSILDAHGGKIGVDSRVGEGSTFFFTLAAAPGDA